MVLFKKNKERRAFELELKIDARVTLFTWPVSFSFARVSGLLGGENTLQLQMIPVRPWRPSQLQDLCLARPSPFPAVVSYHKSPLPKLDDHTADGLIGARRPWLCRLHCINPFSFLHNYQSWASSSSQPRLMEPEPVNSTTTDTRVTDPSPSRLMIKPIACWLQRQGSDTQS